MFKPTAAIVQADGSNSSNGSQTGPPEGPTSSTGSTGSTTGGDLSGTGSDEGSSAAGSDTEAIVAVNTSCTIQGRVTDDWGPPVAGVVVRALTPNGNIIETVTDKRGRYTLAGAMPQLDPDAEPGAGPDVVEVSVVLSHGAGADSSFAVMNSDAIIALTASVTRPDTSNPNGCEQNFDAWNLEGAMAVTPIGTDLWPDATSIYQYTLNAEELAISLGAEIDGATTLQLQVWCEDPALGCDGSRTGSFFVAENGLEPGSPPIIAMTPARSSANSEGVPDNREYHEYGHYFLWLQTGETYELPAGDTNHGGYYENTSTRDSFVEGFAEFYSMMVSRQIDEDNRSEMYSIGADYDLEADRLPWEAKGWWEEFTVAGLLLDLVDADEDYTHRANGPSGVSVSEVSIITEPSGTIVLGTVINTSPILVRNTDVTVRYMNSAGEVVGTQVTRVIPEVIAPTREGTFFAAPPAGLEVVSATATLGGIARTDDDDVTLDLRLLVSIITGYERPDAGAGAGGNTGVSNIAELHDALVNDLLTAGGSDATSSQIDEIFINHGFFADLDGDRMYDPDVDGAIGESAHPVFQIGDTSYPALIPRRDPDGYDGSFITINTGDASLDAVIQISVPADGGSGSYAYITSLDGSGRVELAVPASDQDANVTIITAGKDFKPVIAFRVDADDFHEKVENGTISELQITPVELESGASSPPCSSSVRWWSSTAGGAKPEPPGPLRASPLLREGAKPPLPKLPN